MSNGNELFTLHVGAQKTRRGGRVVNVLCVVMSQTAMTGIAIVRVVKVNLELHFVRFDNLI